MEGGQIPLTEEERQKILADEYEAFDEEKEGDNLTRQLR